MERQSDDLAEIGVDALRPAHDGVAAGGPDAAAQLRAEEQVQHRHHQHGGNGQHHQRTGDVHLAEKDVVVPDGQALIGLAHDLQVHGPQGHLGQDACQNGGDAQPDMQQARHDPGQQARRHGAQHRQPQAPAAQQHHGADRRTGTDGAVHRQIGDVQQLIGDVNAHRHYAPDEALSHGARQGTQQIDHIYISFLFRFLFSQGVLQPSRAV